MLEKTIKQILKKKVDQWLLSIDDKNVVNAIQKDLIITGGCFTSLITNEPPKDFDCYFRTKDTVILVAEYYANLWNKAHPGKENKLGKVCEVMVLDGANPSKKLLNYYNITKLSESKSRMVANCTPERVKMIFPSDGIVGDPEEVRAPEELGMSQVEFNMTHMEAVKELDEVEAQKVEEKEKKDYFPVFISTNAITLSRGVQIVVRFYGEPEKIHDTYDFEHTKAYYDYSKNMVSIPSKVYECTINKTLIYTGSKYPVCSVFRLRKFIARGWTINAGQLLKMCMQISDLDLNNIDVLEDQLVGVDSIYFMNLIEQFNRMKTENKDFVLTTEYVISIVDKIF